MSNKVMYWTGILFGILWAPKALFAPPLGFNIDLKSGIVGRILTPNGDGANDLIFFRFSNPFDSLVSLKIFDLSGVLVTTRSSSPGETELIWDGRSATGEFVRCGIYIWELESEGKTFNGTLVVAR